jgi:hypothetical protein
MGIVERRRFSEIFAPPPWPIGFLLLVLAISTSIAITRNLWHSEALFNFSLSEFAMAALKFKFITRLNDYYPFVDLISYSLASLLFCCLAQILRTVSNKDDIVFIPTLVGLLIGASWGIMQGLTSFGLPAVSISYRPENFGFGANGFQPDAHAFASHLMIGTIGIIGYVISKNSKQLNIVSISIAALCWLGIVLSKSRVSLLISAAVTFSFFILWVYFNQAISRRYKIIFSALFTSCIIGLLLFTNNFAWMLDLIALIKKGDFSSLEALNAISRDRFELHRAAVRMFSAFPIFGVGHGEFFRLSSNLEFSGSHIMWLEGMRGKGGENSHNYFLQTLAEVGVIGATAFVLIFAWPLKKAETYKPLIPVLLVILSIFAGNIYSHPLLIRENLFVLTIFITLLYEKTTVAHVKGKTTEAVTSTFFVKKIWAFALIIISVIIFYHAWQEIIGSFYKIPFFPISKGVP